MAIDQRSPDPGIEVGPVHTTSDPDDAARAEFGVHETSR
jgi:hypothetical protein